MIKKRHTTADPQVQLAVWIAAEFKKRFIEGYGRSMPVIGITVEGQRWELYIAYKPKFESAEPSPIVC